MNYYLGIIFEKKFQKKKKIQKKKKFSKKNFHI